MGGGLGASRLPVTDLTTGEPIHLDSDGRSNSFVIAVWGRTF